MRFKSLVLTLILAIALPTVGFTQNKNLKQLESFSPEVISEADKVFTTVNSPYCSGRLLRDCPSSESAKLKKEVLRDIASGSKADEIITKLYEKHGEKIRAMPDSSLMGMLGWIVPVVAVAIGGMILIKVVGRKIP